VSPRCNKRAVFTRRCSHMVAEEWEARAVAAALRGLTRFLRLRRIRPLPRPFLLREMRIPMTDVEAALIAQGQEGGMAVPPPPPPPRHP